jgi:hypothetical protein
VPYRPEPAARQRHRGMHPAAAARQAGPPASGPASPLNKNGADSVPPDTPTSRRLRSRSATHASRTRITQPRVHGLTTTSVAQPNITADGLRPEHHRRRAITGRPATRTTHASGSAVPLYLHVLLARQPIRMHMSEPRLS